MPCVNTGENFRAIAGPWKGRSSRDEKLAAKFPTFGLKVVKTYGLWRESTMQVGESASRQ